MKTDSFGCHAKTWRQASRRKAISITCHGPAWNLLCEDYPDANYYFGEPSWFPDQSVMVKAGVTVGNLTEMTLPVMDNRMKAIQNPNVVTSATRRCVALLKPSPCTASALDYLGSLKGLWSNQFIRPAPDRRG